jgi:poly-beta-1,6-N-acetyl-D-glucosamine synthase
VTSDVTFVAIIFWASIGLLVFADLGYPALLAALVWLQGRIGGRRARDRGRAGGAAPAAPELTEDSLPSVSVIVAAYAEERVIAERVQNLRRLDYPPTLLEIIVACDGSPDRTVEYARGANADVVLDLPRHGKVRAQDAGVACARGSILAFSDANTSWDPSALRALVSAFADPRVGYVCGDVRLIGEGGSNQEGLYWRYEMALRRLESRLRSVTAGNGAIYATRPESYMHVDPVMGHDLSFPFNMVKRGWRAVYEPRARSTEKMVPTVEGEFARKRRIMVHTWPIVLRGGLLSPRGYDPLYALMILSHRGLRYLSPILHLVAFAASVALIGQGWVYVAAVVLQLLVLAAAALAPLVPFRPLLIARYYVLTTASLAAGLWDWLAHGTPVGWDPVEETR